MKPTRRVVLAGGASLIALALVRDARRTFPDVHEFSDFAQGANSGLYLPGQGLIGKGVGTTVYRMQPHTSTKTGLVDRLVPGQTNPCRLIRCAGGHDSAHALINPVVADFTVQGTDQGHCYGGLTLQYSNGLHVHDVMVTGIPGNGPSPPGETFSMSLWHADNALVEDIVLHGAQDTAGSMAAATLLGINSVHNVTVRRYEGRYSQYGNGIAVWDSSGVITLEDLDLQYCHRPVNFEQAHDGTIVTLTRVNFSHQRDTGVQISFNTTLGRAKLFVVDPITDRWPIRVGISTPGKISYPGRGLNTMDPADAHLIINGEDVSADTSLFIRHW